MPLTPTQIKELKDQLRSQITHLPPDKKAEAETQIEQLSPEALETMLSQQQGGGQQIFRRIANKEIPSVIIQENGEAIAILEINPITKGHTLIVPKKQVRNKAHLTIDTKNLSKEIAQKIKDNLKPKDIKIIPNEKFGEIVIDILPEYDQPVTLQSQRHQAEEKDLKELTQKINTVVIKKEPPKLIKKTIPKEPPKTIKRNRRIP